ncbi:hypothetical protein QZH41_008384 [Actinostola sp. cb2023]|nr:hypothetical protein QZH41_008384 [Actinostola sp. cb2023]
MSSSESSLESSNNSEYTDSEFELEIEDIIQTINNNTVQSQRESETTSEDNNDTTNLDAFAYSDEPLAGEEWIAEYNRQEKETEELEENLTRRLDGTTPTSEWCKCGHCVTRDLQNLSECYCCSELDGCVESLESDLVLQDFDDGTVPICITQHPGFNAVCLQKWSLRLAADKYRTRSKKAYKQTGSEESFLHSVAYREFSRMVYGFLGKKRYPLPACAYSAIRVTFVNRSDEGFTGFEMEEEM